MALRTTRLHEQLAAQVARAIVSGERAVGDPIPSEPEVVEEYGVSKTVVRETVQALASAGLVRVQHGKRTVALGEENWDILNPLVQEAYRAEGLAGPLVDELYAVRLLLEPQAARWTAERAGIEEVEALQRILDQMGTAIESADTKRFLDNDREFHFAIGTVASNRVLRAILRDIHELVLTSWILTELSIEEIETVFKQHGEIVQAIAARKPSQAEKAMRVHLVWAAQTDRSNTVAIEQLAETAARSVA